MASEHPESPSAQPLLRNFDIDIDTQREGRKTVSLRSLEDGEESGDEFEQLNKRPGFWQRLRMSIRRRNGELVKRDDDRLRVGREEKRGLKRYRWRKRLCLVIPVVILSVFGIIHITNFLLDYVPLLWDDPAASAIDWSYPGQPSSDIASHIQDITRDVMPIPCHSHNDYWRRVPLYDALRWGCTGVEADVWLFDSELYVGHSTHALTPNRTFRSMYVDPLVKMLDDKNQPNAFPPSSPLKSGIFDTAPSQTLVLLVDFKNNGPALFPIVSQHLRALREKGHLTYFNGTSTVPGPITVVATGNAPFDLITANTTYRDIFFDAPLAQMYDSSNNLNLQQSSGGQGTVGTSPTSHFSASNSYYASVNFRKSIGWVWWGRLSATQLDLLRGQIRGAHARGLKARYWGAPTWPVGLRNRVWDVLVEEGVDYLNGDDLRGMVRVDWGVKRHWSVVG